MSHPDPTTWPRLTDRQRFEHHPAACCLCGQGTLTGLDPWDLIRWQEHDEQDRPTDKVAVLCKRCSDAKIERHPRLYGRLPDNKPLPGTMPGLCDDCRHRTGLECRNPLLKRLGGPGLPMPVAPPIYGFWDGTDGRGRRTGGRMETWPSPPSCDGRELKAVQP